MKQLALTSALIGLMIFGTSNAWAEKPNSNTYIATMSGVTCGGCKKSVTSAFQTLNGFISIKINRGNHPGIQRVTVISTSSELTREDAVAALGHKASRYIVHAWERQ